MTRLVINDTPRQVQSLPIDCWLGILEHLDPVDLPSLTLVSQSFYTYTQPLLYHTISWEWNTVRRVRILQLLRSILRNPELTLYIKHVDMLSAENRSSHGKWEDLRVNETDWDFVLANYGDVVQQAQAIVYTAKFPEAALWSEALQYGNVYAFVSIFLSQLHNLQSLRLDFTFVWKSGFPGLMLKHALLSAPEGSLSNFNSLTTVDYGSNVPMSENRHLGLYGPYYIDGYPLCDPNQFMAWFHLPSIRSLSIWLQRSQDVITSQQQANLRHVHTLIIARSTIQEEEVPCLLSQMPALRRLHLGIAYRWPKSALTNGSCIIEGLGLARESIEKLSLSLEYYPAKPRNFALDYNSKDCMLRLPFRGFLKKFPQLISAELPAHLLILNEDDAVNLGSLLPSTLQELCLHQDNLRHSGEWYSESQIYAAAENFLPHLKSYAPEMKRVTTRMCARALYPTHHWRGLEMVEELCRQSDIQLRVVLDDLSPGLWVQDI